MIPSRDRSNERRSNDILGAMYGETSPRIEVCDPRSSVPLKLKLSARTGNTKITVYEARTRERENKRVFRSPGAQKRHCTLQMLHDADHHHYHRWHSHRDHHQPPPPATSHHRHRSPAPGTGLSSSSFEAGLVSSYARRSLGGVSVCLRNRRRINTGVYNGRQ